MTDDAVRPGEFDAWIASRSAALTRFAYLLTGSEPVAELALTSALGVACATWSRVRRTDDPEAYVQRLVVEAHLGSAGRRLRGKAPTVAVPFGGRAAGPDADDASRAWSLCATLPPADRAAVVLRCYAEMTYPQIAAVLGVKESAARAAVEDAFTSLRLAISERRHERADKHPDEHAIESAFRAALTEHAEDPSDPGDRATPAHAAARRRRRRGVLPALAAGALLAAVVAGGVASYNSDDATTAPPAKPGDHPPGWRAESFDGIQLWVPSAWGWGQAPPLGSRDPMSCGLTAYSPYSINTSSIHLLRGAGALPYVGRPAQPDAGCAVPHATGPHVWFDSPLPPGTAHSQTTVAVHGGSDFTITVADANRTERSMILRSIEHVGVDAHGCPRDSRGISFLEGLAGATPPPSSVRTMSLCVYAAATADEQVLFYSTQIDGADARQATAQVEAAPVHSKDRVCLVTPAVSQVVLIARTSAAPGVFGVNAGRCPEDPVGYVTGSSFHVLTEGSLRLWAIDGLSLYASPGRVGGAPTTLLPLH